MNKETIKWLVWLVLMIIWNYGFPEASPFEDVVVAVFLSLLFILAKKLKI